jgi:bacterioferritin-associated ferredoxin
LSRSVVTTSAEARPDAIVCHCRQVSYGTVEKAIRGGRATSLGDVQRKTTACTRCFGCRFELERMLVAELGDRYRPAPAATLVEHDTSRLHRLVRRVRPRPEVLPRRMYMPVLEGYGGSDVTTRVTIFNWRDEHDTDGSATPTVRADLLALDGTRLAVWESAVPPRGTAVLEVRTLFEQAGRAGGAAVVKLVVDASTLASLRPYFHYVSPGGVTTTHEKAGGRHPDDLPARWYHWVFPMGESRIEDDPYVFLLNTQTEPMTGQELIWAGVDGSEQRWPVPSLELDQSVFVPLREALPRSAEGRAGTVRLAPPLHKVAGHMMRHEREADRWRVQHL